MTFDKYLQYKINQNIISRLKLELYPKGIRLEDTTFNIKDFDKIIEKIKEFGVYQLKFDRGSKLFPIDVQRIPSKFSVTAVPFRSLDPKIYAVRNKESIETLLEIYQLLDLNLIDLRDLALMDILNTE